MNIILFLILAVIIFMVDFLWIGILGKSFYVKELAPFIKLDSLGNMLVRGWAGAFVYALMSLGTLTFVLPLAQGTLLSTFGYGFLFGFILYGVYDFTNYAIFPEYSWKMVLVDMLWGSLLCGLIAVLAVYLSKFI